MPRREWTSGAPTHPNTSRLGDTLVLCKGDRSPEIHQHQPRNCNPVSRHGGGSLHTLCTHPCCGRVIPQESECPPVKVDLSKAPLSTTQKEELQSLLNRFAHVFAHPGEPPGQIRVTKHDIKVSTTIQQLSRCLLSALQRGGPTGSPEHASDRGDLP